MPAPTLCHLVWDVIVSSFLGAQRVSVKPEQPQIQPNLFT